MPQGALDQLPYTQYMVYEVYYHNARMTGEEFGASLTGVLPSRHALGVDLQHRHAQHPHDKNRPCVTSTPFTPAWNPRAAPNLDTLPETPKPRLEVGESFSPLRFSEQHLMRIYGFFEFHQLLSGTSWLLSCWPPGPTHPPKQFRIHPTSPHFSYRLARQRGQASVSANACKMAGGPCLRLSTSPSHHAKTQASVSDAVRKKPAQTRTHVLTHSVMLCTLLYYTILYYTIQ